MKNSDRYAEAALIGRLTEIIGRMDVRLARGARGWQKAQAEDWLLARNLCAAQVERMSKAPPAKVEPAKETNGTLPLSPREIAIVNAETQDLDQ